MKLAELKQQIDDFIAQYGDHHEVFFEGSFDNEVMVNLDNMVVTTLTVIPDREEE